MKWKMKAFVFAVMSSLVDILKRPGNVSHGPILLIVCVLSGVLEDGLEARFVFSSLLHEIMCHVLWSMSGIMCTLMM